MFRVSKVKRNVIKDARKREHQKACAGRSVALEIVSHLDEEFDNKNMGLVSDKSGIRETIPVRLDNNDNADTTNPDEQNHDNGDEEGDLDDDDVWFLSENMNG